MELEINVIDAFTDIAFKGNSAAVILVDDWLSDELMLSIAQENNLSETAFVKKVPESSTQSLCLYEIRWFSPITEIDFCGHATLAASFVIFSKNENVSEITFFAAAVGELLIKKLPDGYIQMSFPNYCPQNITDIPQALFDGLSIKPPEVLRNDQAYFVVYENVNDVISVEKNCALLKQLAPFDIVVTAHAVNDSSNDYDFISRYFWPANGGDEDPVTGSIHAGLAPLWSKRLEKNKLLAYQASARGGVLHCEIDGDRILISGKAIKYLQGIITV